MLKRKNRLVSLFMAVLMLAMFSIPASANQSARLSTYNIVPQGNNVVINKDEFNMLLSHSPTVANLPRFTALQQSESSTVTLMPNDLLYLWLYDGAAETIADTVRFWSNSKINIHYADGAYMVSSINDTLLPSTRSGSGYVNRTGKTETKDTGGWGGGAVGLRVYVTATFEQVWAGGSTTYARYVSYSTSTSSIAGYARDTIESVDIEHSGSSLQPYENVYFNYRFTGGISNQTSYWVYLNA